jgi:ParB family chromosome partitioning protein
MSYGLGRGLSSLIPQKTEKKNIIKEDEYFYANSVNPANGFSEIDPELIDANPFQPRRNFVESDLNELADSIKEYGIIHPLVITRNGDRYELISGERRLRASKIAGLKKVPAIIRDYNEQKKLELALVENLQREDLNPIEKAVAYKQLMDDFSLTYEEVSKRVGKSRAQVSNTIRLLALPESIRGYLANNRLTEGHAMYLLGIENPVKQLAVFRKIVQNKWTIEETNKEVRRIGGTKSARIKNNEGDRSRLDIISKFFGAKTEIKRAIHGGKIIVDFWNDEELDGMVDKLK